MIKICMSFLLMFEAKMIPAEQLEKMWYYTDPGPM